MKRSGFSATALAIVGVLALGASSVLAGGPPVVNQTDHVVNATDTSSTSIRAPALPSS